MFLILNLCFRIIHNDQIKHISNHKHIDTVRDCSKLVDVKDEHISTGKYTHTYYCGNGNVNIERCVFGNFEMVKPIFQNYAYLILTSNANLDVKSCRIYDIKYRRKLICTESESKYIYVSDTTITNCQSSAGESLIFDNHCKTSTFINNKIDMNNKLGRVFNQKYHTGCTMTGNIIRNTNYENDDYGSGIHCPEKDSGYSSLRLSDSIFNNCKGKNPSIICIWNLFYDLEITNVTFDHCTHTSYGGYFFSITASKENPCLTFNKCTFQYLTSNSEAGGGIGLWFKYRDSDKHTITFKSSHFKGVRHESINGGGALCIIPQSNNKPMTNSKTSFNINNCTFANDNTNGKGGAIYYEGDQMITIFNSSFTNCVSSIDGHAIYIKKENVETITISYCNFTDCGSVTNTFVAALDVSYYVFSHNVITFTNRQQSCGGVKAGRLMNHVYEGNLFHNIKNNQDYHMSCITEVTGLQYTYQIKIEKNTFDSIDGNCQGRCVDVELGTNSDVSIKNNTFKNCPIGGFLIKVSFSDLRSEFIIDNCYFINNIMSTYWANSIGCNSQVWIQNKDNSQMSVKFFNCYFESNHNYKKGGAIFYGNSKHTIDTKVFFNNCKFLRNTATEGGGAISIVTYHGCRIENCEFTENKADAGCSAIYIETSNQNSANIEIISSNFKENGKNIENSVVSFSNSLYTPITIQNCNFLNCKITKEVISVPSNVKSIQIKSSEIKFTNSNGQGGISIQSTGKIEINSVKFLSTSKKSALRIVSSDTSNEIIINECTFDSCSLAEHICFYLSLNSNLVTFQNTIINNIKANSCTNYVGLIDFNNKQITFKMRNVTFTNNVCHSLYGGGIGVNFINMYQIIFQDCNFSLNQARQDNSMSRPNQLNKDSYYNGDGGAIQLGYNCKTNDILVDFEHCYFENNKAQRHGGALAIQTLNNVIINDCTFSNNLANYDFDKLTSSELLVENHFDKKKNGKGGAIYINSVYTYDDQSNNCQSPNSYLPEISISICNFRSNYAHDGYAIYIEGDETETVFKFNRNDFFNNYNPENHGLNELIIYGAVITTEIHSIKLEHIIDNENSFDYNNNNVVVPILSYVDHYGNTKTKEFTESDYFPSRNFTFSQVFSNSAAFSVTEKFSYSKEFSKSNCFDPSKSFSKSSKFSNSFEFSESERFTLSNKFVQSEKFTQSGKFTQSDKFVQSDRFTESSKFSESNKFSQSDVFTQSGKFDQSNAFTQSNKFVQSDRFTQSGKFTQSNKFVQSDKFTQSNKFSNSNHFSNSDEFSVSNSLISKKPVEIETVEISNAPSSEPSSIEISNTQSLEPSSIEISNTQSLEPSSIEISNTQSLEPSSIEISNTQSLEPSSIEISNTQSLEPSSIEISNKQSLEPSSIEISDSPSSKSLSNDISESSSKDSQSSISESEGKEVIESTDKSSVSPSDLMQITTKEDEATSKQNTQSSSAFVDDPSSYKQKTKKVSVTLILGIVIGLVALIAIFVIIIIFVIRKKKYNEAAGENAIEMDNDDIPIETAESENLEYDNPLYKMNTENDPFDQAFNEDII